MTAHTTADVCIDVRLISKLFHQPVLQAATAEETMKAVLESSSRLQRSTVLPPEMRKRPIP
jgi:hypothetical protein